jgi:hypothetical protein
MHTVLREKGLVIPKIPEEWKTALKEIQSEFPGATIVGGALQDLVLGKPIADVDIFIPHHGWSTEEITQLLMGIFPVDEAEVNGKYFDPEELEQYQLNMSEVFGVWNIQFRNLTVQVITLKVDWEDMDLVYLTERCDFGICRIAFDGELLFLHEHFEYDVMNSQFTLRRNTHPNSHITRYARIAGKKYPDWPMVSFEVPELNFPTPARSYPTFAPKNNPSGDDAPDEFGLGSG